MACRVGSFQKVADVARTSRYRVRRPGDRPHAQSRDSVWWTCEMRRKQLWQAAVDHLKTFDAGVYRDFDKALAYLRSLGWRIEK